MGKGWHPSTVGTYLPPPPISKVKCSIEIGC
uniref:Uncharacterized protein n=1 Tax=Anguilla anguilla TaxID=7936 RepID=A0A0E9U2N3_ANGAN